MPSERGPSEVWREIAIIRTIVWEFQIANSTGEIRPGDEAAWAYSPQSKQCGDDAQRWGKLSDVVWKAVTKSDRGEVKNDNKEI